MSVVPTVPAEAPLPRPVAARRVLLTLLLLGGFLVLAFLFGGTARAASCSEHCDSAAAGRTPALLGQGEDRPGENTSAEDLSVAGPEQGRTDAGGAAARLRPDGGPAYVVSGVLEPLARTAGSTAGGLTRPVGRTVEGVGDAVGLSRLTDGLGLRPGDCGEGGDAPGDDGEPAPDHGGSGPSDEDDDSAAHSPGRTGRAAVPSGTDDGRGLGSPGTVVNRASDDGTSYGDGGAPGQVPFHQGPVTPATGVSSAYAGDGNSSRGGPLKFAVEASGAEHSGVLRPGAVRTAGGAPTRDRAAEVLEFPG